MTRTTGGRWLVALLALTWAAAACSSAEHNSARAKAQRDLRSLQQALRQTSVWPYQTVRYNPAACECPQFEVLVRFSEPLPPRWVRCTLEPAEVDALLVEKLLDRAQTHLDKRQLRQYYIVGTLETGLEALCEKPTVTPCARLVVEEVHYKKPALPEPPEA